MDLLTLSRTYPVITFVTAVVLFAIGFRIAKKLFWILAGIVIVVAMGLWFL